jgi:hypothetical protein
MEWGVGGRIFVTESRSDTRIGDCELVTNLGFVRPIDRELMRSLSPRPSIALMWEAWEFRADDLDLAAAREMDIPVLATNEGHPWLQTTRYLGPVAMRLLLNAGIELVGSSIAVIGSGDWLPEICSALRLVADDVQEVDTGDPGRLASSDALEKLTRRDAVVVAEHRSRRLLIGAGAELEPDVLASLSPGLVVAHIAGGVDREALSRSGVTCTPDRFAQAGYMSVATDFAGPRPLIDLHVAGLKIGQLLVESRRRGASGEAAERDVVKRSELAQLLLDRGSE